MAKSNSTPAAQAPEDTAALVLLDRLLNNQAVSAWKVHNTLAFMIEAVPADKPDGLPLQCMLISLKSDMDRLASDLMCIPDQMREASHA